MLAHRSSTRSAGSASSLETTPDSLTGLNGADKRAGQMHDKMQLQRALHIAPRIQDGAAQKMPETIANQMHMTGRQSAVVSVVDVENTSGWILNSLTVGRR